MQQSCPISIQNQRWKHSKNHGLNTKESEGKKQSCPKVNLSAGNTLKDDCILLQPSAPKNCINNTMPWNFGSFLFF